MKSSTEKTITFSAHALNVDGVNFPAEYSISPGGTVFALVEMQNGSKKSNVRITITPDHAQYVQALEAAQQENVKAAPAEEPTPEATPADPKPMPEAATEPEAPAADPAPEAAPVDPEPTPEPAAEPEAPAEENKQACGTIPTKPFIGQTIQGETWKIYFDGTKGRTRVIFTDQPSERAREAVQAAGFYWSPVMESWNKKLTFKAYRAAQALALQLRELCA